MYNETKNKTELLIPDDILRYSKLQMAKRYFRVTAWLLFAGFVMVYYASDFREGIGFWTVPVFMLITALALVFGKVYELFDKTWAGDIEKVKVKTTVKADGSRSMKWYNYVYLYVRTEDGKKVKYRAFAKPTRDYIEFGSFLNHYTVGKKVVHIKGTKYLQIVPAEGRALTCVVCGWYDSDSDDRCDSCKHSLKLVKEDPNAWLWE